MIWTQSAGDCRQVCASVKAADLQTCRWPGALLAGYLLLAATASAQTLTTLAYFNFYNGAVPSQPLTQGTDGNFYGTTSSGGLYNQGVAFSVSPDGVLTVLKNFNLLNGSVPEGLILGSDGNLYGATQLGAHASGSCGVGCGTLYRLAPTGALTTIFAFNSQDGSTPQWPLAQKTAGRFYGTTAVGGLGGDGTVFGIIAGGALTTLASFAGSNGSEPGALIVGSDGSLYGTTLEGGSSRNCTTGCGTVFKVSAQGRLITLASFDGTHGSEPSGALAEGANGDLYGTTYLGGTSDNCGGGCGTVFRISPTGQITTVINFDRTSNGARPRFGLVPGSDGNFYGTTEWGGTATVCGNGCGTVFQLTPQGQLTTLVSFDFSDGQTPDGLTQGTDGSLYGVTAVGGPTPSDGTVFKLDLSLKPFVLANPGFGGSGSKVLILGTSLGAATAVFFNGAPASFKVLSPTAIAAFVPQGATSGVVTVTTPAMTLATKTGFVVVPGSPEG